MLDTRNSTNLSPVTVGIDVGDRFSSLCALGEDGHVAEEAKLRTAAAAIDQRFRGVPACRIVIEAGPQSPWISRQLAALGHDVIVANPHRVRLIAESRWKDDRTDAEVLARLGRIDPALLSPIRHRSENAQNDLSLLRSRDALVTARSLLINHARGVVKTTGSRLPACGADAFPRKVAVSIPPPLLPGLAPVLTAIATLTQSIRSIDREIVTLIASRYPEAMLLRQVPGVGPITSLAFVLTLGDPRRFERSRAVGSYLGLTPRKHESGQRSPQLGISKAGDGYLRRLLVQAAHYILGHHGPDSDLRRWGLEHAAAGGKNGKKRAVIAVARKLAILLHRLWVSGQPYELLRLKAAA